MNTPTILVVNDCRYILASLRTMVERAGYNWRTANGGEAALASVAEVRPDLILLDDMMPDLHGYDVIRALRSNSATAYMPIIIFTSSSHFDDRIAAFKAGADDVLATPIAFAELKSYIRASLARKSQPRLEPFRIFVTHRANNNPDAAKAVYEALAHRFGEPYVLIRTDAVTSGMDARERLESAVEQCSALLVLMGSGWLDYADEDGARMIDDADDPVRIAIATALRRGLHIFPVLLEGVGTPDPSTLPPSIRDLEHRYRFGVDPYDGIDMLIRQLEALMR